MIPSSILLQEYIHQTMSYHSNRERLKDRVLQKFYESRNLPRKKKKRVRKELQLDWAIACWDPFQF
jgi:hypothetical protein